MRFAKIIRYGRTRTNLSVDVFNALNADTITASAKRMKRCGGRPTLLQSRFVKFSAQFDF